MSASLSADDVLEPKDMHATSPASAWACRPCALLSRHGRAADARHGGPWRPARTRRRGAHCWVTRAETHPGPGPLTLSAAAGGGAA